MSRFRPTVLLLAGICAFLPAVPAAARPAPSGGAGRVEVRLRDFAFAPSTVRVTRRDVVVLRNASRRRHSFSVPKVGLRFDVGPRSTSELVIVLPKGRYALVCRFHRARGMRGTVAVR